MAAQYNIDKIIFEYFNFKKTGFFVEVGVCDPENQNNTYLLEKNGWNGILIEPSRKYNSKYSILRPKSLIENVALVSKKYKTPYIYFNDSYNENGGFTSTVSEKNMNSSEKVQCDTLENVLYKNNIKTVDFLSIDVEGYENEVMEGIDVSDFNIKTIVIELHNLEYINNFDYLCEYYEKKMLSSNYHLFFSKKFNI